MWYAKLGTAEGLQVRSGLMGVLHYMILWLYSSILFLLKIKNIYFFQIFKKKNCSEYLISLNLKIKYNLKTNVYKM